MILIILYKSGLSRRNIQQTTATIIIKKGQCQVQNNKCQRVWRLSVTSKSNVIEKISFWAIKVNFLKSKWNECKILKNYCLNKQYFQCRNKLWIFLENRQ